MLAASGFCPDEDRGGGSSSSQLQSVCENKADDEKKNGIRRSGNRSRSTSRKVLESRPRMGGRSI